ncbi:MAG TPA: hypothetical protein VFQ68_03125 [Streptosporangiaceae bacterium]|nr:hypothetical protein [Streptosporangiaceae bacterium]
MLAGQLDGYGVLAAGLARHEQACPALLFCFGSPRREQAARRALAATRAAAALRIATAALNRRGGALVQSESIFSLGYDNHVLPAVVLFDRFGFGGQVRCGVRNSLLATKALAGGNLLRVMRAAESQAVTSSGTAPGRRSC